MLTMRSYFLALGAVWIDTAIDKAFPGQGPVPAWLCALIGLFCLFMVWATRGTGSVEAKG